MSIKPGQLQAFRWRHLAAQQGDAHAQTYVGTFYQDGSGVTKDLKEAVRWFRMAAEQGNREGQNALGNCFLSGIGIPQDNVEAVSWFQRSAEQGFAYGQVSLGDCYSKGVGVKQNLVEAFKWLELALKAPLASWSLGVPKRLEQLAKSLTPDQIAQARQSAARFVAKKEASKARDSN